ncbi:hypothetical protein ACJJTC_013603 [Scirpophaga incertulas]
MEPLKRKRTQLRREFTKQADEFESMYKACVYDSNFHGTFSMLSNISKDLFTIENNIRDLWCAGDKFDEEAFQNDQDKAMSYRQRWNFNNKRKGELGYEEYEKAEILLIRLIQENYKDLLIKKLKGFLYFSDKDNIIRLKTKLLLLDVPEATKFPAVLSSSSIIIGNFALRDRYRINKGKSYPFWTGCTSS